MENIMQLNFTDPEITITPVTAWVDYLSRSILQKENYLPIK